MQSGQNQHRVLLAATGAVLAGLLAGCTAVDPAPYGYSYEPGGYVPAVPPPAPYYGSGRYGYRDSTLHRTYDRGLFHHPSRDHGYHGYHGYDEHRDSRDRDRRDDSKRASSGSREQDKRASSSSSSGRSSSSSSSASKKSSGSGSASKPAQSDRRYRAPNPDDQGLRGRRSQIEEAKKKKKG